MEWLRQFWHLISTPEGLTTLVRTGGLPVLALIFFAETGMLVGFLLPGDSLLFVAGFLASPAGERIAGGAHLFSIVILNAVLIPSVIIGDSTGYLIGFKAGPPIFNRPQSRLFRRDYLLRAHAFYEKHGGKTIIMARFVPIIRTFAPVVAGAAGMPYRIFLTFSVIGSIGWVTSMTLLGYFLGQIPWIQQNLEKAVIAVILLSLSPMMVHFLQERRRRKLEAAPPG